MLILVRVQDRCVAHQTRFILRRLTRKEAVKILEAIAGRPIVKRAFRGRLLGWSVMPLTPGPGVVAVILQHLRYGRRRLRNLPLKPSKSFASSAICPLPMRV